MNKMEKAELKHYKSLSKARILMKYTCVQKPNLQS